MANAIEILIQAKDQASNVIKNMAGESKKNISGMSEQIEAGLKRTSLVLAGVGAGLTVYAKKATDHLIETVGQAKALARQTGDTVENASRLNFALQRMGIDAGAASTVFNSFSKQIKAANEESGEAAAKQAALRNRIEATKIEIARLTKEQVENGDNSGALRVKIESLQLAVQGYERQIKESSNALTTMNIRTRNADGSARAFNAILLDVADRFQKMPDGVDKTNLALELFGRQGGNMVKVLNKGSEGIQEMMAQADKLGLTITSKNIAAVDAYIKSQKELKDTTDALKIAVGTLTTPVLAKYNEVLNQMLQKVMGANAPTKDLIANIAAFGGPVAGAAAGLIGFIANIVDILPLFDKFGKGGRAAGGAAASGMGAAAGGAARLLPMLGWVGLAIAAVGAAAFGAAKIFDISWNDTVNFFNTTVPAGIAQGVELLKALLVNLRDNWASYLGQMIGFVATLPLKLPVFMAQAIAGMVVAATQVDWAAVGRGFVDAWRWQIDLVKRAFLSFLDWIRGVDWGGVSSSVGKGVGNAIIGYVEGAIKGALSGLPGNPGSKIKLPRFATGTNYAPGGLAVVGERGPELVNLRRGSQVVPNRQTEQLVGGSHTEVHYHGNIYLQTVDAVREFVRLQDENSSLAAAGLSVVRP